MNLLHPDWHQLVEMSAPNGSICSVSAEDNPYIRAVCNNGIGSSYILYKIIDNIPLFLDKKP